MKKNKTKNILLGLFVIVLKAGSITGLLKATFSEDWFFVFVFCFIFLFLQIITNYSKNRTNRYINMLNQYKKRK